MRTLRIGLAVVAIVVVIAGPSAACTCDPRPQSVSAALEAASAVFIGRVLSVPSDTNYESPGRYVFQLVEAWKGIDESTDTVTIDGGLSSCTYHFKKDVAYLVYAHGKRLFAGECSRTVRLDRAESDLNELGTPIYRRKDLLPEAVEEPEVSTYPQEEQGGISIPMIIVASVTALILIAIAAGVRAGMIHMRTRDQDSIEA